MKVYVTTMAEPFKSEVFMNVYSSRKKAEKGLRAVFQHMRPTPDDPDCFTSDNRNALLLFIREKEVL